MPVEVRKERVFLPPDLSLSFQRAEAALANNVSPHNLGALPVHPVGAYASRVPPAWNIENSVFVPVLPDEAIWLGFAASREHPRAVQLEFGHINAVSGMPGGALSDHPRNYFVCPPQMYWDGVRRGDSLERWTADVLHSAGSNQLKIIAFELLPRERPVPMPELPHVHPLHELQETRGEPDLVIEDPYGLHAWDVDSGCVVWAYFVNPTEYEDITGEPPPAPRRKGEVYTRYRLP